MLFYDPAVQHPRATAGDPPPITARRVALPAAASTAASAALIAGALTAQSANVALRTADAAAVVAGSLCIGVAVLIPWLSERDRARAWTATVTWAMLWVVSAMIGFVATAGELAGKSPARVSAADYGALLHGTFLGQWGVVGVVCPIVLSVIAVDSARGGAGWHGSVVGAIAALGLVSGPVTGHLSLTGAGWVVISVHVIAAALWFGPLLAAAVLVRDSDTWTRILPRYSRLAFWCLVAVAMSGLGATIVRWATSDASTSYYALVVVKMALLVTLGLGGRRLRRVWVRRDCPAAVSTRRAVTETLGMAAAVGVAAALAITP